MIWIDEPYRNGGFGKKVVHLHSHRFLLAYLLYGTRANLKEEKSTEVTKSGGDLNLQGFGKGIEVLLNHSRYTCLTELEYQQFSAALIPYTTEVLGVQSGIRSGIQDMV